MSKRDLIVKSNRLVEASYRLSLAEQRIILYAIALSRQTGQGLGTNDFLHVSATDYAEMFGLALNQAYEQIKEAAKTLFKRYVVLYERTETGGQWVDHVHWLSSVGYNEGEGKIRLRFAPEMTPFITRLEAQFTRYRLEKIARMSSVYAIRLYELLMQWESTGHREVELEWIKKTLMVDTDYPRIFDFKKRVLDVAISQINEYSDITVRYVQKKTGRNVTHILFDFSIKESEQPQPVYIAPVHISDTELFKRLRKHGIGIRMATNWIKQNPARVKAAIEYVETRAKQGQVSGSTAGYLRTVFESDAEIGASAFEKELNNPSHTIQTKPVLTRKQIEKNAYPGESWEQARNRLSVESPPR